MLTAVTIAVILDAQLSIVRTVEQGSMLRACGVSGQLCLQNCMYVI